MKLSLKCLLCLLPFSPGIPLILSVFPRGLHPIWTWEDLFKNLCNVRADLAEGDLMSTIWIHCEYIYIKIWHLKRKLMKTDFFLQILYYVMSTSSVIWQSWRGLETRNKKRERSSQERSKARKSCLRFLDVYIISNVTLSRSVSKKNYGFWHPLPMPMGLFRHISLYILDYTLLPKYESKLVRKSWQISKWIDGRTVIVINRTFESLTFQHFFHEPTFHSVFYKLILCYFSVAIRVHSFPGQKCTVDMLWSRILLVGVEVSKSCIDV